MGAVKKFINEATPFKILVDKNGLLLSVTTKRRAFYFFLSTKLVGLRTGPTTDPYPGIVEVSGYDIEVIVRNWERLSNLKLRQLKSEYSESDYSEYISCNG